MDKPGAATMASGQQQQSPPSPSQQHTQQNGCHADNGNEDGSQTLPSDSSSDAKKITKAHESPPAAPPPCDVTSPAITTNAAGDTLPQSAADAPLSSSTPPSKSKDADVTHTHAATVNGQSKAEDDAPADDISEEPHPEGSHAHSIIVQPPTGPSSPSGVSPSPRSSFSNAAGSPNVVDTKPSSSGGTTTGQSDEADSPTATTTATTETTTTDKTDITSPKASESTTVHDSTVQDIKAAKVPTETTQMNTSASDIELNATSNVPECLPKHEVKGQVVEEEDGEEISDSEKICDTAESIKTDCVANVMETVASIAAAVVDMPIAAERHKEDKKPTSPVTEPLPKGEVGEDSVEDGQQLKRDDEGGLPEIDSSSIIESSSIKEKMSDVVSIEDELNQERHQAEDGKSELAAEKKSDVDLISAKSATVLESTLTKEDNSSESKPTMFEKMATKESVVAEAEIKIDDSTKPNDKPKSDCVTTAKEVLVNQTTDLPTLPIEDADTKEGQTDDTQAKFSPTGKSVCESKLGDKNINEKVHEEDKNEEVTEVSGSLMDTKVSNEEDAGPDEVNKDEVSLEVKVHQDGKLDAPTVKDTSDQSEGGAGIKTEIKSNEDDAEKISTVDEERSSKIEEEKISKIEEEKSSKADEVVTESTTTATIEDANDTTDDQNQEPDKDDLVSPPNVLESDEKSAAVPDIESQTSTADKDMTQEKDKPNLEVDETPEVEKEEPEIVESKDDNEEDSVSPPAAVGAPDEPSESPADDKKPLIDEAGVCVMQVDGEGATGGSHEVDGTGVVKGEPDVDEHALSPSIEQNGEDNNVIVTADIGQDKAEEKLETIIEPELDTNLNAGADISDASCRDESGDTCADATEINTDTGSDVPQPKHSNNDNVVESKRAELGENITDDTVIVDAECDTQSLVEIKNEDNPEVPECESIPHGEDEGEGNDISVDDGQCEQEGGTVEDDQPHTILDETKDASGDIAESEDVECCVTETITDSNLDEEVGKTEVQAVDVIVKDDSANGSLDAQAIEDSSLDKAEDETEVQVTDECIVEDDSAGGDLETQAIEDSSLDKAEGDTEVQVAEECIVEDEIGGCDLDAQEIEDSSLDKEEGETEVQVTDECTVEDDSAGGNVDAQAIDDSNLDEAESKSEVQGADEGIVEDKNAGGDFNAQTGVPEENAVQDDVGDILSAVVESEAVEDQIEQDGSGDAGGRKVEPGEREEGEGEEEVASQKEINKIAEEQSLVDDSVIAKQSEETEGGDLEKVDVSETEAAGLSLNETECQAAPDENVESPEVIDGGDDDKNTKEPSYDIADGESVQEVSDGQTETEVGEVQPEIEVGEDQPETEVDEDQPETEVSDDQLESKVGEDQPETEVNEVDNVEPTANGEDLGERPPLEGATSPSTDERQLDEIDGQMAGGDDVTTPAEDVTSPHANDQQEAVEEEVNVELHLDVESATAGATRSCECYVEGGEVQDGDHDSGVDESTQGKEAQEETQSPTKKQAPALSASKLPRSAASPTKKVTSPSSVTASPARTKETLAKTTSLSIAADKKLPMNKVVVGTSPSPNLKVVRSKIGSLENVKHRAGGGNVKLETKKIDVTTVKSKIGSTDNIQHKAAGGEKKVLSRKLEWKAQSKIGSLDNATHKAGGGTKKIETQKLDFKDKAKPKVGSRDNITHKPGGGDVKIEEHKLEIVAQSKIGSLDYASHKPGGGNVQIFDEKNYFRNQQQQQQKELSSSKHSSMTGSDGHISDSQSPVSQPVSPLPVASTETGTQDPPAETPKEAGTVTKEPAAAAASSPPIDDKVKSDAAEASSTPAAAADTPVVAEGAAAAGSSTKAAGATKKGSPTKGSPTKGSPTKGSPTKGSPTKAGPAKPVKAK